MTGMLDGHARHPRLRRTWAVLAVTCVALVCVALFLRGMVESDAGSGALSPEVEVAIELDAPDSPAASRAEPDEVRAARTLATSSRVESIVIGFSVVEALPL